VADPEINELRRGDVAVRIEPKAMDVLMMLADRVGRVVTHEELFLAVWAGVIVGDEALTQTINKLRKALGDNARSPSYIETIAKRAYRLIAPVRQRAGVALSTLRTPAPLDTIESGVLRDTGWVGVAVAPFDSLGPEDRYTYLARGINDNLMTDLSRLSGLRVIREAEATTARSGALRARYRVSGSVQRDGNTLRVNVHLADTTTHEELWSERFDRPFGDIFAIQDELAARLAELLPAKVSGVERERLAKRYTRSVDAYDHFLQAKALFLVRGDNENEQARVLYRKALELDPKFACAYGGLAMTYAMDARLREPGGRLRVLERAFDLAETAREIDPDIPEVYWALGFVHAQSRQHEQAIDALQKAIVLDRSFADAYALLGGILTYTGQPARSIPLLRTALRLNPGGGYLYFMLLGRAFLFENDPEQALINLRAASLRNPADLETRLYGGRPASPATSTSITSRGRFSDATRNTPPSGSGRSPPQAPLHRPKR
jgi:DNA-binding winged helix-turn-helix (wHTH) protein/TolB-like protein/Tfp pilus assembly protein PilF